MAISATRGPGCVQEVEVDLSIWASDSEKELEKKDQKKWWKALHAGIKD